VLECSVTVMMKLDDVVFSQGVSAYYAMHMQECQMGFRSCLSSVPCVYKWCVCLARAAVLTGREANGGNPMALKDD